MLWRGCKEQIDRGEKQIAGLKAYICDLERIVADKTQALEDAQSALQALKIQFAVQKTHAEEAKLHAEAATATKSEFLSSMSHELRTPLNSIIGFSEILRDGYFGPLNERQAEYIRDIYQSGRHLLDLINDILDISRIEAGRMELEPTPVNLDTLLHSSTAMIKEKTLKHNIAIRVDVAEELKNLDIYADELKLKQIIFNLLSNAAKFTQDGGKICIKATKRGLMVGVTISDNGIGVSPEELESIFEPFYQVMGGMKDKTPGTGLGLALSRRFIEMHGGQLWAESKGKGRGSDFSFTLPMKQSTD